MHQDAPVELHKSSYDPETFSTPWPGHYSAHYPVKRGCEHPLLQGIQGSVGKAVEEVLLSLVCLQKNRAKRLNGLLGQRTLWQSRGFHVTSIPVQQCGHEAVGGRSSEALPSHPPLPRHWQDYVLNPEGRLQAPDNCLLWGCYWSLWHKGVSQACW